MTCRGTFFYLQESGEEREKRQKAATFLRSKLFPDIREVKEMGPKSWNLGSGKEFYLDGSIVNPLFDVYNANIVDIGFHTDHVPYRDRDVLALYRQFFELARSAYVLGEKLDDEFYQIVRRAHHTIGVPPVGDASTLDYLKAKVCSDLSEEAIIRPLGWRSVSELVAQIESEVRSNSTVQEMVAQLKEKRTRLMDLSEKITSVIRHNG